MNILDYLPFLILAIVGAAFFFLKRKKTDSPMSKPEPIPNPLILAESKPVTPAPDPSWIVAAAPPKAPITSIYDVRSQADWDSFRSQFIPSTQVNMPAVWDGVVAVPAEPIDPNAPFPDAPHFYDMGIVTNDTFFQVKLQTPCTVRYTLTETSPQGRMLAWVAAAESWRFPGLLKVSVYDRPVTAFNQAPIAGDLGVHTIDFDSVGTKVLNLWFSPTGKPGGN